MPKGGEVRADGKIWYSGAWRSPESVAQKREHNRIKKRKQWNTDEEFMQMRLKQKRAYTAKNKETINSKKREKYQANLEENRKIEREKKRRQIAKDPEAYNEKQREYYRRNNERLRKQINAARVRRDPTRGLATALREFERGDRSFASLDRLYRERLTLLHEVSVHKPPRKRHSDSDDRQNTKRSTGRKNNK